MPNDFTNKSFQKVLRGYSAEEVDSYIDYINTEYKKLERKCADSERKLALAQKKIDEYINGSIQDSPITTQAREVAAKLLHEAELKRNGILSDTESKARAKSSEIIAEAERKSAEILDSAEAEAEAMLTEARSEADGCKERAAKERNAAKVIFDEVNSFREKLYALYNSHLETIDSMSEAAHGFIEKLDNGESVENGIEYSTDSLLPLPEAEEPVDTSPASDTVEECGTEYDGTAENEDNEAAEASDEEQSAADVQAQPADISFIDRLFTKISENEGIIPEGDDVYVDIPEDDFDENELIVEESDFNTIEEYEMDDSPDIDEAYEEESDEEDEAEDSLKLSIDWKSKRVHQNGDIPEYNEYDDSCEIETSGEYDDEDEDEEDDKDYYVKESKALLTKKKTKKSRDDDLEDIDKLFVSSDSEMSLTDEFNVIFAEADSRKNVSEIRRQPTIVPDDEPKNKKHRKR